MYKERTSGGYVYGVYVIRANTNADGVLRVDVFDGGVRICLACYEMFIPVAVPQCSYTNNSNPGRQPKGVPRKWFHPKIFAQRDIQATKSI